MALTEEKKAQIEAAERTAKEQFESLFEDLSAKQKEGAAVVVDWIRANYVGAGYRRLCRFLLWERFPTESN